MVNNSWKTVTLSQIGTFQKGSGISRAESNSGTLPAVRYGELYTVHNNYVRTYTSHVSREVASKALRVHYGDILFACSGETKEDIAKCAAIIDDSEVYAGGDIIVLSPTTEVDPIFLGFILNTQNVIQQRAQKAQGDAIVHISTDSIKSIEITLPEYEEQVRIAEALSDIDTLIVNLEKLIAKKKAIKQGTMQELLTGKRRLPGFDGEWKLFPVSEIGKVITGATPSRQIPGYWNGDFPWVSAQDFLGKYISDTVEKITVEGMKGCRILPSGAVLITCIASIGLNAITTVSCATNQQINALICNNGFNNEYVYYSICHSKQEMMKIAGQTAVPILNKSQFEDFRLLMPQDIDEQRAIAAVLADIDQEISQYEKQLMKYIGIKQGMMSELLTGNIRLIDKEDA